MGTSPTLNYKYFDPFNFASDDNFAILREAELKHGRIAMLAVIGQIAPDLFWKSEIMEGVDPVYLSPSQDLYFQNVDSGLGALSSIPIFGWLQIISFIGYLENRVFVQKIKNAMPGDYGTGYFGVRNKGENERSLRSELENGRLAMIAFLGQVIAELVTGLSPYEQIQQTLGK
ncbi:hypothetical protein CTEN210_18376 [Chaetoceros tenuissimus]|uniref:Chlorophyll a-b binding protein, chloroplastic n=1 Tax=Chaetoceros tenuissimus TaxID=426638 RepID=A0AAD3DF71_9STRA|nr:hypothetical protein CTEN210_18376 [Chaetoceros tenuissimus]